MKPVKVTHKCGHTETHHWAGLKGKTAQTAAVRRAEGTFCSCCTYGRTRPIVPQAPEDCQHEPAPRNVPKLGAPLPTCKHCGIVYMPDDDDTGED